LNYLHEKRGFDFSGNRMSMLERRISKRLLSTEVSTYQEYFSLLHSNPDELDELLEVLTINVSNFFRDPLTWEILQKNILPILLEEKKRKKDNAIRIWSAGCASGEEPYSLAILLSELLEKEDLKLITHIFATDIDQYSMQNAKKALFTAEDVGNVKFGLLNKYFLQNNEQYALKAAIKDMVKFSNYDLLDKKSTSPPLSIYGNFDIIFCRNVLIYFNAEFQDRIFGKLYNSLNTNGYLILGEAEIPNNKYKFKLRRIDKCCKIYQKR